MISMIWRHIFVFLFVLLEVPSRPALLAAVHDKQKKRTILDGNSVSIVLQLAPTS